MEMYVSEVVEVDQRAYKDAKNQRFLPISFSKIRQFSKYWLIQK